MLRLDSAIPPTLCGTRLPAPVVATAQRLVWTAPSLDTHRGRVLQLLVDPPAVVAAKAKEAVRRWRFPQFIPALPDLCTDGHDLAQAGETYGRGDLLPKGFVDLSDVADKLLRDGRAAKHFGMWENFHRPSLVSAFSEGQWPQARLATVRDWTSDRQCQLCNASTGTLAHRHRCPAPTPHGRWPEPSKEVREFFAQIGAERMLLLETRGLLGTEGGGAGST